MKGTKPGDIPIEEPMTFELIVDARVAKSFDLADAHSSLGIHLHSVPEAVDTRSRISRDGLLARA
jgi:hypothetical protein